MGGARYPALRFSRHQPPVLRGAGGPAARKKTERTAFGFMPSGEPVLAGGNTRWAQRGHHHGIHAARRSNDGDPFGFGRSRHPNLSPARAESKRRAVG